MSEHEKSGEGFLGRWSRRKIESEREPPAPPPEERLEEKAVPAPAALRPDVEAAPAPSRGGFDLSKLPSLESITASTDIRGFLAPGVPKEIARAALRRAWAADPAIRDFKGLAENDWDFTDPTAMPGFGSLPAGLDVKKMVAQIFGQGEAAPEAEAGEGLKASSPAQITEQIEPRALEQPIASEEPEQASAEAHVHGNEEEIVHRESIVAAHNSVSEDPPDQTKVPRQHGGALPK